MSISAGRVYAVEDVLPHAEGMRLLDQIDAYGADWVRSRIAIGTHTMFAEPDSGVPAWVGVEYMAQTAGALGGIEEAQLGRRPSVGVLIGTREYHAAISHFPIGAMLLVTAQLVMRDEHDFVAYECRIENDGAVVATAVLKAYRPRDVRALLANAAND